MENKVKVTSVVSIDELNLDKECISLPSDYLKYAHRAADTKRDVDSKKAALEALQAKISNTIRKNPEKYGLDKVTEASLSAAVILQGGYQVRQEELIDARHLQETAQAYVWALECKKRSLTMLVELHGMGYFSNPKISQQGREAVEQMVKKNARKRIEED